MIIDQLESAFNRSYEDKYDNNHNKKYAAIQSMDANRCNQSLLEEIEIFKTIHERKYKQELAITSKARTKNLREIQTSSNDTGNNSSF